MDDGFQTIATGFLGALIAAAFMLIAYATFVGIPEATRERAAWQSECEKRGGVILDRTYTSGKYAGHNYSCVRKDLVIE